MLSIEEIIGLIIVKIGIKFWKRNGTESRKSGTVIKNRKQKMTLSQQKSGTAKPMFGRTSF